MHYCYKEIKLPHLYSTCVVDVALLYIKIVCTLHHFEKKKSCVIYSIHRAPLDNFISVIINSLGMSLTIGLVQVVIYKFLTIWPNSFF